MFNAQGSAPRLSRRFSREYVTHRLPLLLPGLPGCPPSASTKIIPCVSREASDWLLRPELAAVQGGWPMSQLTEGVVDSSCLLVAGVVAVSAPISAPVSLADPARYAVPIGRGRRVP